MFIILLKSKKIAAGEIYEGSFCNDYQIFIKHFKLGKEITIDLTFAIICPGMQNKHLKIACEDLISIDIEENPKYLDNGSNGTIFVQDDKCD